ncbi:MAG: phosphotransacetylase family protein [Halovenus sp.]
MTTLLVTSTAEGTGKTAITVALASLAREAGNDVGYMKPKGTRLESTVGKTRDEDPMLAREVLGLDAGMHELEPVVYSPTLVREAIRGREGGAELADRLTDAFDALAASRDHMFLEGGSRHTTGGIVDLTDADVAELLDAEVLLVSRYDEPRDIDDVLAATEDLGDRLTGVLFNDVASPEFDELTEEAMPFLDGRGIRSIGAIPHDEQLAGVTVDELVDSLGAERLTDAVPTDGRIERFSVGAMGAGSALKQFRRARNSAVITGGDRSDIQTTALEAPGVACLILTGGYRPSQAVIGKAAKRDVPVLLVQSDTRATIDRVEETLRSGRAQRVETVERMADLLRKSVDVDELLG